MPTDKDKKRLIRARMKKTGESYTAARAVIVARGRRDGPEGHEGRNGRDGRDGRDAVPRSQWAALAGVRDAAVQEKTGRTWAEWVAALDQAGAERLSHRDIARHVSAVFGIGSWWSQAITVGYERIRGRRVIGQRADGSYDANKSRTFGVDVATLYQACANARRRKRWLPEGVTRVRATVANKSIRADWHDGSRVNLFFTAKAPAKSTLTIEHAKLPSKSDVERAKSFWSERLDALAADLTR